MDKWNICKVVVSLYQIFFWITALYQQQYPERSIESRWQVGNESYYHTSIGMCISGYSVEPMLDSLRQMPFDTKFIVYILLLSWFIISNDMIPQFLFTS